MGKSSALWLLCILLQLGYVYTQQENCGVQGTSGSKIVGGQSAQPGAWPWMVGIYSSGSANSGNPPFCGGTLIRDNVVLTAAHCFNSINHANYEVKVGDHDVRKGRDGPQEEVVSLARIYKHEGYNEGTNENDVALLILDRRVRLSSQVQIACLPTDWSSGWEDCVATGWGTLSSGGVQPHILHEVTVPTMDNGSCNRLFAGTGLSITDDMICAGVPEGGKDACQGDSGGPLVCRRLGTPRRYELRGVTSWGVGCARAGRPGVYARVYPHLEWINRKISEFEPSNDLLLLAEELIGSW